MFLPLTCYSSQRYNVPSYSTLVIPKARYTAEGGEAGILPLTRAAFPAKPEKILTRACEIEKPVMCQELF